MGLRNEPRMQPAEKNYQRSAEVRRDETCGTKTGGRGLLRPNHANRRFTHSNGPRRPDFDRHDCFASPHCVRVRRPLSLSFEADSN